MAFYICAGLGIVNPRAVDGGNGSARSYAIDPDSVRRIFQCESCREILHSTLAYRVTDEAGLWNDFMNA